MIAPFKVYWNLIWLEMRVGQKAGGGRGSSDYPPTAVQYATFSKLQRKLVEAQADFQQLESSVLPKFNERMQQSGISIDINDQ